MKEKLDFNPVFKDKTVAIHNFIDCPVVDKTEKKDYVLYFGRFSKEKGIDTLIQVASELSDIPFVFAGVGPLEDEVRSVQNINCVGFKTQIR